ncbi:MAG: hypothetical protein RLZZ205_1499 [Bacteroidota bacterium]|jgi:hypothetical protein
MFALVAPTIRPAIHFFEDWMVIVLLVLLSMSAYFNVVYPTKMKNVFKAFRSDIAMRQFMREETNVPRPYLFLTFQHALLMGLMWVLFYQSFIHADILPWWVSLTSALCVLVIYGLKWISFQLVKWFSEGDYTLSEYQYRTFATNRLLAILLYPLIILAALSSIQQAYFYVGGIAVIIGLLIAWRILKGAWVAFTNNVPIFYIFFYICTLEILPVLIGVKLIQLMSNP